MTNIYFGFMDESVINLVHCFATFIEPVTLSYFGFVCGQDYMKHFKYLIFIILS